jgi:RNA polymerase sigma-70 factor (ECF subfamily)
LVAILRRRIIDRWRRRPRPGLMAAGQELDVAVTDRDPLADGYTDRMQQALGSLNDQLRETLLLVVVAELTHQETADLLDVPLGTVLSRVSRARQRLRQFLLAEARQE